MNKTKIKTMLMFALAMVVGSVWASYTPMPRYTITSTDPVVIESPVVMPRDAITSFTVTIMYESGGQRSNISQVELVDPVTGDQIAIDVHDGYSGTSKENHVYTLSNIPSEYAGKVLFVKSTVRCDQAGTSTCRIDLSNGVEHYMSPYSFGINFTGGDNQNLADDAKIGFTKDGYGLPETWINVRGAGTFSQTAESCGIFISGSSRGMHNSGVDVGDDFGKLTYGYLDDVVHNGLTKVNVAIAGLPVGKKYAVALILAGDGNDNTSFSGFYSPVLVNGEVYSYVTENGVTSLVKGDAAKTDAAMKWGDRRNPANGGPTSFAEGTNVMFIEGLSGSMLSITSAIDVQGVSRLTIAGVQVWVTDEEAVIPEAPTDKEVISLNFAYGNFNSGDRVYAVGEDDAAGLVSACGWNNLIGSADNSYGAGSGTTLKLWDGESVNDMAINYSFASANSYEWSDATDVFLKSYLDDGTHGDNISGPVINVSNIPFDEYSVIVYCATDSGTRKFRAITINGRTYNGISKRTASGYSFEIHNSQQNSTSGTWGSSHGLVAEYGKNVLRVDGLSGNLTVQGGNNGDNARGCIAALQIVNTGAGVRVIDWTGKESLQISELQDVSGAAVILKLSPDAVLNFDSGLDCRSLQIYSDGAVTVNSNAEIVFEPSLIVNADMRIVSDTIQFKNVEIKDGKTLVLDNKTAVSGNLSNAGILKYAQDLTALDGLKIVGKIGFSNLTLNTQQPAFGGTLVIQDGDSVSFNGTGPQRISMPIEMTGGQLNLSTGNSAFWLGGYGCLINQSGGTVVMCGANTGTSGSGAGLLLGWTGGGPTYNLSGGLLDVQSSHVNLWNTSNINISGGELKTLGFFAGNGKKDSMISLSQSGKLTLLGSQGLSDVFSRFNLNGGEVSAKETTSIASPVAIAGENAVVAVDSGKVLTVSQAVSGDGDFVKTGSGILAFTGSLRDYSGSIVLKAGKIRMPVDSEFSGEVVTDDPTKIVAKIIEDGFFVYKLSNSGFFIRIR